MSKYTPDPSRPCVICGAPLLRRQKNCCSVKCQYVHARGVNHPAYKGGSLHVEGYRVIRVDGKSMLEHRHFMEQHIGRRLLDTEVVHHIDGNKANNEISNLELLPSQSAHMQAHRLFMATETHRQCTRCYQVKSRSEFYPIHKPKGDPHHPHCKECQCSSKRLTRAHLPCPQQRLYSYNGVLQNVCQWSRDPACMVKQSTLFARLGRGWSISDALTVPVGCRPESAQNTSSMLGANRA